MTLNDEESVKKALGISSFREMSKEKMLSFAASMPEMAKDVRLKLIEQIPAFREFALDAVNAAEQTFTRTVDSNDDARDQLHDAFADVRDAITSQLAHDGISEEHRRLLTEQLIRLSQQESEKDSENKHFLAQQADGTRKVVVALAGSAGKREAAPGCYIATPRATAAPTSTSSARRSSEGCAPRQPFECRRWKPRSRELSIPNG